MTLRRGVEIALVAVALLVLLSLVLGHALGQPMLLTYVETGSMEPTIEEGDGFIAVPAAVASPVEQGDVIVFDAQEIDGGGYTTHRVVGETAGGYVTRGDANVVTDQDGGEPPVTDGQIAAKALQVNGEVVTIPHLGTAVMGIQSGLESGQWWLASTLGTGALLGTTGISYLLLAFGLGILVVTAVLERGSPRSRSRSRGRRSRRDSFDARTLVLGMALLIGIVTLATMAAMSGSTEFGIVSAEYDSDAPHVVQAGDTDEQVYELQHGSVIPVVSIAEPASSGIEVDESPTRLERGDSTNVTATVTTPPETGYYLYSFADYRYFAVLPTPIIATLHAIHPWLAMGAVTSVVVGVFVLPFALLVGTGTIRTRERRRAGASGGLLRGIL